MNRLIEKMVFSGFVTAWRLATWPTRRSPVLVNATTDGVSRLPSGLVMTTGSPPSMTATTELVVPRSMPMILLMCSLSDLSLGESKFLRISTQLWGGNGGYGANGFTRRHGDTETHGGAVRLVGARRARTAAMYEGADTSRRWHQCGVYLRPRTSRQSACGGRIERP